MNFPENDGVKYSLAQTEQRNPIEVEGEAQKPATESPKAEVKEPATAEPAAEAKAEPEAKVAEKAEMPKVEESATAKTPEIVKINTVSEITDEDFQKPYRSLELPSLPERTLKAMGKEAKPVLLKQNILVKNRNHHPELSEKDSRTILQKALYESNTFICDKTSTKPNYWVLVEVNGKNSLLTIEISETKTHHEIVGWRFASEKSVNQIKNRAEREGGQVLVTESNAQGASGLHALPSNSGDTVTPEAEKSSEAVAKVEEKAEEKTGEPEVMSLDQFLASRGVAAPISDFMIDKLKIPHGLTARQEQQFHKEAEAARNAYHNKRDAAIEEYERLVAEGKIRKPTIIEEALRKAHGNPDNPSVQAARRVLKKRGIDWRTGEPLAESAEENKTPEATAAPAAGNEKKAAPPRRRAAVEENGEALDSTGRVQLLSSKPAGVNFKDAKVYLDRGSGYSRVRLAEKGNDLYALFTGQNFKNRYIKIADYQNTTPAEVIADIPNQGRNFEDALHDYYDAKGLNLGYAAPLNRMKMPASQSEAPAVKSAEQKFNEAKTFPARCHELIDLNDGSYTINGISFVKDGTLYQVDGLTEKVNARLLTQILGKAKKPEAGDSGVKFSIIGERGALNLNDGEERLHNRALAERMLDEGKDARTVKLATGWERWHDKKWRMELPDLQVNTEGVLPDGTVYSKGNTELEFFDGKLYEYVKAPELFRAYPQLRDMHLAISVTDGLSNGKCYGKTIVLELNRDFNKDNPADMKSLQKLLIHEVQHAILSQEGFPRGSSPDEFALEDERTEEQLEKQRQGITQAVRDFAEKLTAEVRKDAPWNFAIYDEDGRETLLNETQVAHAINDSLIRRGYTGFSDLFQYVLKLDGEEISWDGLYDENGDVRLLKDDVQRIDRLCREYHNSLNRRITSFQKYNRTAGEAEARNAARRSEMTEAEKRGSLLDETGDILPDDLIYLNDEGTSAMTPLRRPGDPNTAGNANQLRDGNVPYAPGFLEWAGLKGNRLYADYEFLYGRHSQYFSSPEDARAAVELVLARPEKVQDLRQNLSFARMDEKTGKIYRIEISPEVKQRYNHIVRFLKSHRSSIKK